MPQVQRPKAILVVGVVAAAAMFAAIGLYLDHHGFVGNVLSELTGLCLGVAVAVLLVDRVAERIQATERAAQNEVLHDSLSRILGFLVEATGGNPFHWSKHARHAEPLVAKLSTLRDMKAKLDSKSFQLNVLQEKCVVESAHEACETVRSLAVVAFQLSGSQGLLWLSLSNSVTQLAKLYPYKAERGATERRTISFGQDSFSSAFCELVDDMLLFEEAKAVGIPREATKSPPRNAAAATGA